MSSTRQFGKLSREQLREFFALHYESQQEASALRQGAPASDQEKLRTAILAAGGWGGLYVLPARRLALIQFALAGLLPQLIDAGKAADPHQALLDLARGYDPAASFAGEPTEAEIGAFVSVGLAVQGNVDALAQFNVFMSELVARVAAGEDQALFQAVMVDRVALQAPPIAARIGVAQLLGDEAFMEQLAKAVTRSVPRRPRAEYDDLRLMAALLDEAVGLSNLTDDEVYELLIDDLELYPDGGQDPAAGLKWLLRRRRSQSRR